VNWGCAISENQISDSMPNRLTDINCFNRLTLYAFSDTPSTPNQRLTRCFRGLGGSIKWRRVESGSKRWRAVEKL
jgi:hypothetical protein